MSKAKRHPHVAEELRIAERTVGLNATCAICGKLTGYDCRAHFVARIDELEGHRRQWRTRALRLYDSLSVLSRLSEQVLHAPVREAGIVVNLELRARIQRAVSEAQDALNLESPPAFDDGDDEDSSEHKGADRRDDNEGKGNG